MANILRTVIENDKGELRRLEKIADRSVSIASLLQFAKLGGDIVQS